MGTFGAGKYLEDHIEDLYREVKTRRFSVLMESEVRRRQPRADLGRAGQPDLPA